MERESARERLGAADDLGAVAGYDESHSPSLGSHEWRIEMRVRIPVPFERPPVQDSATVTVADAARANHASPGEALDTARVVVWRRAMTSEGHGADEAAVREIVAELLQRMPMSEAEFRYRVERLKPFREAAMPILIELLDSDAAAHDLATAALHELATSGDSDRLAAAFRAAGRSERARADIAQVLTAVAADDLERLLGPEEIQDLSLLSIDTLLDRLRDRAGTLQVVELYQGSSRRERRALLDAIGFATGRPNARVRLGTALDALFAHEEDEALRALMIRRASQRSEPASARALARWLGHVHGAERRRLLEALRRLGHFGLRAGTRSLEAWMSGVDTTGSFNVGISFPAALDLRDLVLACISVDAGLRAVNLITAVSPDTAGEIGKALEEGQSIPVTTIDVPTALRHIEGARQRTVELGRALPEGYGQANHYLRRPLAVAVRPPAPLRRPAAVSRVHLAALAETSPYSAWTFGEGELETPKILASDAPLSSRRLQTAGRAALRTLAASPAAGRLAAMLRHQSEVHRLRSEPLLATRSLAAALDIEQHGLEASPFARRLAERSILSRLLRGQRLMRADVRELFKRSIEERSALRRRAVATLDLAEALYRQLENLNERCAPGDRLTLVQMESVAIAGGELAATELSRDASEQPRLPGMERHETTSVANARRRVRSATTTARIESGIAAALTAAAAPDRLAATLAGTVRWFADEICLRRCRRGCLLAPELDGRELFFQRSHPAGIEATGESDGSRGAVITALRHHLARRLDDRIATTRAFLAALDRLGAPIRGDARERRRRVTDITARLVLLRQDVERIDEDPAWLYALAEETEQLARDVTAISKHLLGATLGRAAPEAARGRASAEALAAWRRFERQVRRLGLIGLTLPSLAAAIARLENAEELSALVRGVVGDATAVSLARLDDAARALWSLTPRVAGDPPTGSHPLDRPLL
jgi:hypothetical protein